MLDQHKELTVEKLADILFQTFVYRLVNKKVTFERFGEIPLDTKWTQFREFMSTCMRKEREERTKPKNKQNKEKLEKFFTQAHQVQGENKTAVTLEFVKKDCDKMAKEKGRAQEGVLGHWEAHCLRGAGDDRDSYEADGPSV